MKEELWFWYRPAQKDDLPFLEPALTQEEARIASCFRLFIGLMDGRPGGFFVLDDALPGHSAETALFLDYS